MDGVEVHFEVLDPVDALEVDGEVGLDVFEFFAVFVFEFVCFTAVEVPDLVVVEGHFVFKYFIY